MSLTEFFASYVLEREPHEVVKIACGIAVVEEAAKAISAHQFHQQCQIHIRNMMEYICVGDLSGSPQFYLSHAASERPELLPGLPDTMIELDRFFEDHARGLRVSDTLNKKGGDQ